jgi:hypothetical protein
LEVHKTSKEFLKFREHVRQMTESGAVTLDGQSYIETGIGFV